MSNQYSGLAISPRSCNFSANRDSRVTISLRSCNFSAKRDCVNIDKKYGISKYHKRFTITMHEISFLVFSFGRMRGCQFQQLNVARQTHSSFCIIQNFLPNCGRILPALKEKSKKNCPYLGLKPTTSRSSVLHSANCARKESVEKEISEVSFVSCTTSHVVHF